MSRTLTPNGETLNGEDAGKVLFAIAKAIFGADAAGNVTVPDDLTAAPVSFANATFVDEVNAKT